MLPHDSAVQMWDVAPSLMVVILYPHGVGHGPPMVWRSLPDTPWLHVAALLLSALLRNQITPLRAALPAQLLQGDTGL